jgi:biotin operon repressor
MNAQQAMQAALANQQTGLTVGQQNLAAQLGIQQLGTQTGVQTALANLSSSQQAAVQNQAAQNQARGMNSQQALQAALANQQAGLTVGQQNLAAQLGIQQLGAQTGLQAQLANQQYGLNAQQMAEQSRQFGAGQGLNAAQLQAQYGQAAQQLAEQSRQYGAGLGMQGGQLALGAAGQLGTLGGQYAGQMLDINKLQNAYGGQQQAQAQNILGAQYQDFLSAQQRPYQQLGFMSDMIRGLPLTQQSQSMFTPSPSMASQAVGLGTAAMGASKLFASGGRVGSGLADLAIANMA